MINSYNTLLLHDKAYANPVDFAKTIKPIPVTDRVIEVDVIPIITIASTDSNTLFRVLHFLYLFLI